MLREARNAPSPKDLSIRELIVRIRWERAKREQLEPGTRGYQTVGLAEARLLLELHRRFGVENIAAADLEWYVLADHGGRVHSEGVESA
jgi:hypothetical protein